MECMPIIYYLCSLYYELNPMNEGSHVDVVYKNGKAFDDAYRVILSKKLYVVGTQGG